METPSGEIKELYEQACAYDEQGDVYNSIKLYKRVIKRAANWLPPYLKLVTIYKARQEWKAALHYCKKAVAIEPGDQATWWNLSIAAAAVRKWRIARNVWSKFGLANKGGQPICIRLNLHKRFEVLWVKPLDPVRGWIVNIPSPNSDRRYRDIVLFDREIAGYNVVDRKRIPVFEELGLWKRSVFTTWSCQLQTTEANHVKILEQLCSDMGLGFEVWSNATRILSPSNSGQIPEYFGEGMDG